MFYSLPKFRIIDFYDLTVGIGLPLIAAIPTFSPAGRHPIKQNRTTVAWKINLVLCISLKKNKFLGGIAGTR